VKRREETKERGGERKLLYNREGERSRKKKVKRERERLIVIVATTTTMVFVTSDQFQKAYQWIKEDSLGGGCTVLIFVSPDTDSLCACRILTSLLQSEFISYNIKPVSCYEDVGS